jgi:predicted CXXCH cytochrome family protein
MAKININRKLNVWLVFIGIFGLCLAIGAASSQVIPAEAAPQRQGSTTAYAGSAACSYCHQPIHEDWVNTRHAHAFSSPIFQRDWSELAQQTSCLECHTTGFDKATGTYAEEGVSCESCHGAFNPRHPAESMSVTPNAELCATCHLNTTNEWMSSAHGRANIQCESCHNPHSQTPLADSVTALCSNCHKDGGDAFAHSTHANAGLECSNCHMYTTPRFDSPIGGLIPTGHTFSVGSDACIACHMDTVHTRDEIVKLSGEIAERTEINVQTLQQTIQQQESEISNLKASSAVRLYTGLVQGAIVGLMTGGVAAWVVSRRIRVIEIDEEAENG